MTPPPNNRERPATPRVKLRLGPARLGIRCNSPLVIPAGLEGFLTRDPPDEWLTITSSSVFARYPKSDEWDAVPAQRLYEKTGLPQPHEKAGAQENSADYNLVLQASTLVDHVVRLLDNRGILVHAFGCKNPRSEGYLFCGPSGAGKTTLAKRFEDSGFETISDDRLILWQDKSGGFKISCYPWQGRTEYASEARANLRALFLLGTEGPRCLRITSFGKLVQLLSPMIYLPQKTPHATGNLLAFLEAIFLPVPVFQTNRDRILECHSFLEEAALA